MTTLARSFTLALGLILGSCHTPPKSPAAAPDFSNDYNLPGVSKGMSQAVLKDAVFKGKAVGNLDENTHALIAGEATYAGARNRWELRRDDGRLGKGECYEGTDQRPGNLERFFSRAARQKRGGAGCACLPLDTVCASGTCLCSEICPNDYSILSGRAGTLMPTDGNAFAFTNSTGYNDVAFKEHPMKDGYCTGMSMLEKKFTTLAYFDKMIPGGATAGGVDPLTGEKIPVNGTPEFKSYIKRQIKRVAGGKGAIFPYIKDLKELSSDPEYQTEIGTLAARDWAHFNYLGNRNDSDSFKDTLTPMPKARVQALMARIKATTPRFDKRPAEIRALLKSNESIGITDTPERQAQLESIAKRPTLDPNGPWERLSLSLWSYAPGVTDARKAQIKGGLDKDIMPKDQEVEAHAVSAYAHWEDPNTGDMLACIRDPNDLGKDDEGCDNPMRFKKLPNGEYKIEYQGDGFPDIGLVRVPNEDPGQKAAVVQGLYLSCKKLNEKRFAAEDCNGPL